MVISEYKGTDVLLLLAGAGVLLRAGCRTSGDLYPFLQLHTEPTMAQKLSGPLLLFGRKKARHPARPNLSFFVFQV